MRIPASLLAAGALLAASSAAAQVQQFHVRPFNEVSVAGPFDVTITTGTTNAVTAEGDPRDLAQVRVDNDGNDLEIRLRRGARLSGVGRVRVRITTATGIRDVSAAGSVSLSLDRTDRSSFEASNAGSGSIDVTSANSREVEVSNAGNGHVRIAGQCTQGEFSNAGGGSINAERLSCAAISISNTGSGTVNAHASRTASVTSVGSGNVTVSGGARCSTSRLGSGNVDCRP